MGKQFVIDCGSRSIKLHEARPGAVSLHATRSWDPINDATHAGRVGELLADLTKGLPAVSAIHVVGTAAARRDRRVADAIGNACLALGWTYETLTQSAEADLILNAFGARRDRDIINVGGGSIQIVRPSGHADLLQFGISDLNSRFSLTAEPAGRRIEEACAYVRSTLPRMPRTFIYSGGELSYLVALGAEVDADGRIETEEFFRVAAMVDSMACEELEAFSPFERCWILGAPASNAIVKACLIEGRLDHYYASDINIADGIISGLAGKAA